MEIIPKQTTDDGVRFPSLEEDLALSDNAIRARRALKRQNPNAAPRKFKREAFLDSIAQVFEELGGAPRLIEWADQNYGDFATKLLGKTLTPAINQLAVNASGPVQIVCPIQRSALDDSPDLTPDGLPLKDTTHDST
jgi:hypothetical protein